MPKVFVINSTSHCGSTMVSNFVAETYPKIRRPLIDMASIDLVQKNCSFHNHSPFPYEEYKYIQLKVLYMFGDLFNTIYSLTAKLMLNSYTSKISLNPHACKLLCVDSVKSHLFYQEDVLKFKRHFDNWNCQHTYPVLSVRYESMYDNLPKILDFLEIPKKRQSLFPPYKKRKTNWKQAPQYHQDKMLEIYGEDYKYFNKQPDIKEWYG